MFKKTWFVVCAVLIVLLDALAFWSFFTVFFAFNFGGITILLFLLNIALILTILVDAIRIFIREPRDSKAFKMMHYGAYVAIWIGFNVGFLAYAHNGNQGYHFISWFIATTFLVGVAVVYMAKILQYRANKQVEQSAGTEGSPQVLVPTMSGRTKQFDAKRTAKLVAILIIVVLQLIVMLALYNQTQLNS